MLGTIAPLNYMGKKYLEAKKLVDPKKLYTPEEAMALIKKTSPTKFDASVEVHVRIGIDASKSDEQIRTVVVLPHGSGQTKRVAAFVPPAKEEEAKKAGADIVGGEDLIAQIAGNSKIDFDVAVATPDMMAKLAKVARILGPKGLMPNPKTDTVGPNVAKMVAELKGGKVSVKNDDAGNVHGIVGKVSFKPEDLAANLKAFMDALKRAKPAKSKGIFIQKIYVSSSMGPSIKIQVS